MLFFLALVIEKGEEIDQEASRRMQVAFMPAHFLADEDHLRLLYVIEDPCISGSRSLRAAPRDLIRSAKFLAVPLIVRLYCSSTADRRASRALGSRSSLPPGGASSLIGSR